MGNVQFREGITETLDILKHMDCMYTDKIPQKFKDFLEENKSESYEPNLDHSKKLNEMVLKEKTKDILAVIYMKYWCNVAQKTEFQKLLNENERKYQAELREKYNPDNIFKNNKQQQAVEENVTQNNVSMVAYKESIFKRFINKIKNILHMN